MEFSRQYLTRLSQESNFIKDALEKVLRLSEILKFLNSDVVFKDKLALKGGTAINLTAVELPRLSVDIDLDFTVNVSRDDLPEIKEKFKKRLTDYMWQEGYSLADSRDHFALTSFLFNYINNAGNRDNIKVEINFLDRCHVLPLEKKKILTKGIIEDFEVLALNTTELYRIEIKRNKPGTFSLRFYTKQPIHSEIIKGEKKKEAEKEIEKAKDEIAFESGFRKFFFWATPVLLLAQAVISVLLLLK